ncbi:response regulator [candidate division KSB1 bacterium]|nr:response regulator [candidate division KSB1 bacterium]
MKKILVVDDQAEVRELVEVTLRSEEYEIIQAKSASEAIEKAKSEKPDLIILDIMMPGGMDGYEVCKILKSDPATKKITIIFLTAKGQEVDKEKGFDAGGDGYFAKPFSPLKLIEKIEEVFKQE